MKKIFLLLFVALLGNLATAQITDYSVFDKKFNFYVANDLGRNGYYDQKTIAELKAKIESLVAELATVKEELAQYKSVRGQLRTADLEQENDRLRKRIRTYEDVISRNNLWSYFSKHKEKVATKQDTRWFPKSISDSISPPQVILLAKKW